MTIQPHLTEKSLRLSKMGKYTFVVKKGVSAGEIKKAIDDFYQVTANQVWFVGRGKEVRRDAKRRKRHIIKPRLAIISLKKGKIDVFEAAAGGAKDTPAKNKDERKS